MAFNLQGMFLNKWRYLQIYFLDSLWYKKNPIRFILWPISFFYQLIALIRRKYLQTFHKCQFKVPVIVVGNISVGGVGKTPLVIALADNLNKRGLKVGIVSRGYCSLLNKFPHEVKIDDDPNLVGDEPLLLAIRTKCPVVISPNRPDALQYLLDNYQLDFIISDDGLQHYAMDRQVEIAVIDGTRMFGNGLCLPAGPLRESPSRLKKVDFIVINGLKNKNNKILNNAYDMNLLPGNITNILKDTDVLLENLDTPIAAVAGIGNPARYFATLRSLKLPFKEYPFPDHYSFTEEDFVNIKESVIMTEKDAVKCRKFATNNMYYLPVDAVLGDDFWQAFWKNLKLIKSS